MTREGDGYGEVVRPNDGKGGPCHIGREMPSQKGDIWRGGMALGVEVSRKVLVRNSELRTVDRPIKRFSSGSCPILSCSGEPGGIVSVKVAKHHLVTTVGQEDAEGIYTLKKVSVVLQRSASTARTSAVSKWALVLGGK